MKQPVNTRIEDARIVVKNTAQHLEAVLGKFPGTLKVIFPVFLFGRFLPRGSRPSAFHRVEQRVDLALR